jgi:hypothetical protein
MVVRSMAQVCDHSIPGIAGSNSLEGMDVCLLRLLCVVHIAPLRLADHSSRGDLQAVCAYQIVI